MFSDKRSHSLTLAKLTIQPGGGLKDTTNSELVEAVGDLLLRESSHDSEEGEMYHGDNIINYRVIACCIKWSLLCATCPSIPFSSKTLQSVSQSEHHCPTFIEDYIIIRHQKAFFFVRIP